MSAGPVIAVGWPKPEYLHALRRAGAQIRELTAAADSVPGILQACDGLLLTGGADVDPRAYGDAERHPTVGEVDEARDRYELALARAALERDVPLLAICRGVQLLNVAAGGTLIQDLPSARPSAIAHKPGGSHTAMAHVVSIVPGSRLAALLRGRISCDGQVAVNSRHHQAVEDPAPGFVVTATSADGVIEGLERPGARFCVGVQWHPESFWETGEFRELFDGLIAAATRDHATPDAP